MSEHLTNIQIEGYVHRSLAAAELLAASDHLAVCAACRGEVELSLDGDAALYALKSGIYGDEAGSSAHLTLEQTAGFVDGILAGEELRAVNDHLSSCDPCVMTVKDLREFRDQAVAEPELKHRASEIGHSAESLWHRFVNAMFPMVPSRRALVFGSALATILLAAVGLLIWRSLGAREKTPVVTQTSPTPASPVITPDVSPPPAAQDSGGMLLAQLNDGGGRITLDRDGRLSGVEDLPPRYRQMVERALENQQFEKSALLAGLTKPGSLTVRGGGSQDGGFSVIEPVGKVTFSDRPTFRWSRLEGATSYVVEIYDDKFALKARSPQLSGLSWTATQSLERGAIYSWQVKAIKDDKEFITPRAPAPQAKFRILDQAKANELAQARRAFASSHLTLALLYAQAGLLDDAERELRALQKANPDSAIVRRLLANVRALNR